MKIHNKLFLVLFSFSFLLVAMLVLLIQWSIGKGMIDYVNNKEQDALQPLVIALQEQYQKEGGWKSLRDNPRYFGRLVYMHLKDSAFLPPPPNRMPPNRERGRPPRDNNAPSRPEPSRFREDLDPERRLPPTAKQAGYLLLDGQKETVVGRYVDSVDYNAIAIEVQGVNIGWLLTAKREKVTDGYELDFIKQQQHSLWLIMVITMLLVSLVTLLLAKHIAEPVKLIMHGMHKLTQGDYLQKIHLNRRDELGELSRDFNELANTLHENENSRKRWLANISHELRTPVAILRGELEAMIDGVRPLQRDNIESANDEVKHLQHLIDDLHQLTSADIGGMHYRKQTLDFTAWLASEVKKYSSYLATSGIELVLNSAEYPVNIFADSTRLCQLFENIMNNCVKYAEAKKVSISLTVDDTAQLLKVTIEDDGIGVPEQHLANLFEYLYRVESSRNRKTGGAGLGLSICAHIVSAHHGKISAQQSSLGGLAIVINIPLQTN
nr:signal transduction histidine-protein kinase BaeS [uncultured bacterium]